VNRRYLQADRLAGHSIALASGIAGASNANAPRERVRVDEAVLSLARAVFGAGGRIVFTGDPEIETLLAVVASEYRDRQRLEENRERSFDAPLTVYVAHEPWRDAEHDLIFSEEDQRIGYLHRAYGDADTLSVPDLGDPSRAARERAYTAIYGETKPLAMVCIGGDEADILPQFTAFRRRRAGTVFVLASTGGAAARLAKDEDELAEFETAIIAESERANRSVSELSERPGEDTHDDNAMPPYPLIAMRIVDAIAK
jgi:hypothetical protein